MHKDEIMVGTELPPKKVTAKSFHKAMIEIRKLLERKKLLAV